MGRAPPPPRGSAVYRSSNLPLTAMLSGLLGDNGGWETKVKGCLGACPPPSFVYFHCFDTGARFGCRTMLHLGRTCVNPYSRPISTLFPSVSFDNPRGRERERERVYLRSLGKDRWPVLCARDDNISYRKLIIFFRYAADASRIGVFLTWLKLVGRVSTTSFYRN